MTELATLKEAKRLTALRQKVIMRDERNAKKRADLQDLDLVKAKQLARQERREREERERNELGIEKPTTNEKYNKPFDAAVLARVAEKYLARTEPKQDSTTPKMTKLPEKPSIFNRSGHLKLDLFNYESPDVNPTASTSQIDKYDPNHSERHDYELPLTTAAVHAINILRAQKDSDDGWSRWRDMKGVEIARAAAASGPEPTKLRSLRGTPAPSPPRSPAPDSPAPRLTPAGMPIDIKSVAEDPSAFCSTCYVPLVKDPRPEQLFIWLHALRYTTTEWDWKSEVPYWARESWEMGDTE